MVRTVQRSGGSTEVLPRVVCVVALTVGMAAAGLSGASANPWPSTIALPDGFRPEGIAVGEGSAFFVGSIPSGDVVRGDLRTGRVDDFINADDGRAAIGLAVHDGVVFVAGGPTGQGYAYDAASGAELGAWQFTHDSTFVNDVVATPRAAYFTDSVNPFLYRVPILGSGEFGAAESIALTGDLEYRSGFNINGIDATPDGGTLVVVQSNTGQLFAVDAASGTTHEIDLDGATVPMGDGILLHGTTLWVVQNRANLLTLVDLDAGLRAGEVVERFTHAGFDVPTTLARMGNRLALVNARFTTAPGPNVEYWVTQLNEPR